MIKKTNNLKIIISALFLISVFIILVFQAQTIGFGVANDETSDSRYSLNSLSLTGFNPIYITDNSGFLPFNGTGTANDPYTISNFDFSINSSADLIHIENTNVYFEISNNYIANSSFYGINLVNVSNAVIENNIIADNVLRGIFVTDSNNIKIANNQIANNQMDGIRSIASDLINVSYNTVEDNGYASLYYGIYFSDLTNGFVKGNTVFNSSWGGIRFTSTMSVSFPSSPIPESSPDNYVNHSSINNMVIENTVDHNNGYGMSIYGSVNNSFLDNVFLFNLYGGLELSNVIFQDIIGNNLSHNTGNGLSSSYSKQVNMENNTIYNNSFAGIRLVQSFYIEILNNIITDTASGDGILVEVGVDVLLSQNLARLSLSAPFLDTYNITIDNNDILRNQYSGIYFGGYTYSGNSTISNNVINFNGENGFYGEMLYNVDVYGNEIKYNGIMGIDFDYPEYYWIKDNDISHNQNNGICLYDSYNGTITNNHIENNTIGINVEFGVANGLFNVISNNDVINNYGTGINVLGNDNNTLTNNLISNNNGYGVTIVNSQFNIINFNIFNANIGISSQALDNGTNNVFNNNYWSDLTNPDSYSIDGSAGNFDNSPLISEPSLDLSSPDDLFFNDSDSGVFVQWDVFFEDIKDESYVFFINGDEHTTGQISDNSSLNFDVSHLTGGVHLLELVVEGKDQFNNLLEANDIVLAHVTTEVDVPAGTTDVTLEGAVTVNITLTVSEGVTLTVEPLSKPTNETKSAFENLITVGGGLPTGYFFEIEVSDPSAVSNVWINISYIDWNLTDMGINENDLKIYVFDEDSNKWIPAGNTDVDKVNKIIYANIDHFSSYAAVAIANPAESTGSSSSSTQSIITSAGTSDETTQGLFGFEVIFLLFGLIGLILFRKRRN
jgi:parallel beta-helix repeat protein